MTKQEKAVLEKIVYAIGAHRRPLQYHNELKEMVSDLPVVPEPEKEEVDEEEEVSTHPHGPLYTYTAPETKDTLLRKIVDWSEEKGIYRGSNEESQRLGAIGELYEYLHAFNQKERSCTGITEELGDVIIYLINAAYLKGGYEFASRFLDTILEPSTDYLPSMDSGTTNGFIIWMNSLILNGAILRAGRYLREDILDWELEPIDLISWTHKKNSKRSGEMRGGFFVKEGD